SGSSSCNSPYKGAEPCTAKYFPCRFFPFSLALKVKSIGNYWIRCVINNNVGQLERKLRAPGHFARRRRLCEPAINFTAPLCHYLVISLQVRFESCHESVARFVFVCVDGVDGADQDSRSGRNCNLSGSLRPAGCVGGTGQPRASIGKLGRGHAPENSCCE